MSYAALDIDAIVESEENYNWHLECDVVEYDFRHRESLSENFSREIDAWARPSWLRNKLWRRRRSHDIQPFP